MTRNRPLVFKGAILSFYEFEVANARNLAKSDIFLFFLLKQVKKDKLANENRLGSNKREHDKKKGFY